MHLDYLIALSQQAKYHHHRFGVELVGSRAWSLQLIEQFLQHEELGNAYKLGGETVNWAKQLPKNGGAQVLGHDAACIVYDAVEGIDANSLTASSGTIIGGGALFVINRKPMANGADNKANQADYGQQWLDACFLELIQIRESDVPASLEKLESLAAPCKGRAEVDRTEQQEAISRVCKVVEGHRKRPLVLTADRGRGKSAALGMAAAQLMEKRNMTVLITAPSIKSVTNVFKHAQLCLEDTVQSKHRLTYRDSSIRFIAPDELLSARPSCDLLLVDEAAAIPVPMLKKMTSQYHRLVFSSTVHGYEGCGRGFSIRFLPWLQGVRPGSHQHHISQPMRWAKNDPLESWIFNSFLLNAELPELTISSSECVPEFRLVTQLELLSDIALLRTCFSLLVNAHYQTSPNDLFHLLSDENVSLYAAFRNGECVACITTVKEGNLETEVIDDIVKGKRRPKGHLVPTTIVNHLGDLEVGKLTCHRVMRIAVHPMLQRNNIGSQFIRWLVSSIESDNTYVATSFGASSDLVGFWARNDFQPIWLGSSKDQASGCYSMLMVHIGKSTHHQWAAECQAYWLQNFVVLLASTYQFLDAEIATQLLSFYEGSVMSERELHHLRCYVNGGAGVDSVIRSARKLSLNIDLQPSQSLLTAAFFQLHDWSSLCSNFDLAGRKQAEAEIRTLLSEILGRFTV